jgi:hypothetical protein
MEELIFLFNRHKVEYMLVGGFAVICYGYIRTTQDIDFLLFPSVGNSKKVMNALTEFGFGDAGIPIEYFQREGTAIHIGVEPNRIDFLTCLQGVSNDTLFKNMTQMKFQEKLFNVISKQDLIQCKKAAGRAKDLADVEELEKITTKQIKKR